MHQALRCPPITLLEAAARHASATITEIGRTLYIPLTFKTGKTSPRSTHTLTEASISLDRGCHQTDERKSDGQYYDNWKGNPSLAVKWRGAKIRVKDWVKELSAEPRYGSASARRAALLVRKWQRGAV